MGDTEARILGARCLCGSTGPVLVAMRGTRGPYWLCARCWRKLRGGMA